MPTHLPKLSLIGSQPTPEELAAARAVLANSSKADLKSKKNSMCHFRAGMSEKAKEGAKRAARSANLENFILLQMRNKGVRKIHEKHSGEVREHAAHERRLPLESRKLDQEMGPTKARARRESKGMQTRQCSLTRSRDPDLMNIACPCLGREWQLQTWHR